MDVANGMAQPASSRWRAAWPDAVAFVMGLGVAGVFGWRTGDLVWSLWLSSLVVGYAMIVRGIVVPAMATMGASGRGEGSAGKGVATVFGGLFLLGFFTVHFGGFHLVHSVFLNAFFPVGGASSSGPGIPPYGEVLLRYWWFLPAAMVAERRVLWGSSAVGAGDAEGRAGGEKSWGDGEAMAAPYKNVVRLHLLIFFFAFAHFVKLESFLVFAVVYAVYFFPWGLLKGARGR
ncbi:MAG: hypothetical protein KF833_21250 [Verrucomicrobiae bacterium]|nr:hypothetical protein [Verrucomicrobiae bacterium]